MKIFALLSIITLSSFSNEFIQEFDTEVQSSYDEYQILEEYTNSYYTIKVVYGLIDEDVRYGVCFYSDIPNEYSVNILHNNKLYDLKENSRGDVSAVALDLKTGDVFSVILYNKSKNVQHINKFENIEVITKEEFNSLDEKLIGEGNGITLSNLKSSLNLDFQSIVYIVFGIVIVLCGLIIIIFYKRRKGMFAADEKSKNVFNFKEFLNSTLDFNDEDYPVEEKGTVDDDLEDQEENKAE